MIHASCSQTTPCMLTKRSDFLRVQAAEKIVTTSMVVHYQNTRTEQCRIGYTVTKRCGNAVKRNRIKRRLRAVWAEAIKLQLPIGFDIVIVGRVSTYDAPSTELRRDMSYALKRMQKSVSQTPVLSFEQGAV